MGLKYNVPHFFKIAHPSGAPSLPNLRRCQALAVKFTAARLMPCIFGKLGACKIQVTHSELQPASVREK